MITVGMNYKVLPGQEPVFERAFNAVLKVMAETEGHRTSHLWRDVNETGSYLITSDWTSRRSFDSFVASDAFRRVTDWGSAKVLATKPHHEIYEKED